MYEANDIQYSNIETSPHRRNPRSVRITRYQNFTNVDGFENKCLRDYALKLERSNILIQRPSLYTTNVMSTLNIPVLCCA